MDLYELVVSDELTDVLDEDTFFNELYDGMSLLHVAIRARAYRSLAALLTYDIDVNMYNDDGDTPLMYAVKRSDVHAVSLLINDARVLIDIRDVDGMNVVEWAAMNRPDVLRILIESRANTMVDDRVLQIAVESGCVACVDMLLDFNLNVNSVMSAYRGPIEILRLLLEAGGDPNIALIPNIMEERLPEIELLRMYGAKVTPNVLRIARRSPAIMILLVQTQPSEMIGG